MRNNVAITYISDRGAIVMKLWGVRWVGAQYDQMHSDGLDNFQNVYCKEVLNNVELGGVFWRGIIT